MLSFRKSLNTKTTTMKKIATVSRKKLALVLVCSAFAFVTAPQVLADRYDDQITAIKNEINGYQSQANELAARGDSLQRALDVITNEKNILQAQIDLNQAKLDQLTIDIKNNEEKLDRQKRTLNKTVAQIYANGDTTPIVMLASSKNVGEYVSAQEVRGSVRDQMKSAMDAVKRLKAELADQKTEVTRVLADQTSQREALVAKEAEQANLVAQTRGEEAAYQNLISSKNSEVADLQAQQRAANARLGGSATSGDPSKGGYTYNNVARPGWSMYGCWPDQWGMCARQCVSYTAFKVEQKTGYMPYWGGRGDAHQWDDNAEAAGIPVDQTPAVGSVAVSNSGGYGHVMWVEQVSGNQIYVSQYNYNLDGEYSEMWINARGLNFIHF